VIDRFGRRNTLWAASAMFVGFSVACYFATNITQLIVFRALQVGVGVQGAAGGTGSAIRRLSQRAPPEGLALVPTAHRLPFALFQHCPQGMAVASYSVGAQAIMADTFPPQERGKAMGLLGIPLLVGPM
jgi:MFS family permease